VPVPLRVRDWFVEVPTPGKDSQFDLYGQKLRGEVLADWPDVFAKLFTKWTKEGKPTLDDVPKIKVFVYELLMRNLRWTECIHFVLDTLILLPGLTWEQRHKALEVVAKCEGTGGGQTLPSYRIPILWESLFLQVRSALSR